MEAVPKAPASPMPDSIVVNSAGNMAVGWEWGWGRENIYLL